jgi:arylsulfatase A-like enzyme
MIRLLSALAIALLAAYLVPGCGALDAAKTRIVLITLDTLRYDGVFPEAGARDAMPRLRARAEAGTRFSRFYAATSVTQPTHATLFTALHPWEHGVTRNGLVLGDQFETLAELLRDAGFETRAVIASYPLERRFGFAQGFDRFTAEFTYRGPSEWGDTDVPAGRFFSLADTVTARAIEALDAARGDRQFFWIHYFDPHSPYGATRGESLSQNSILAALDAGSATAEQLLARARYLYASDLAFLDAALERLFQRLDAQAGAFRTHVFVVSDHGESFGEGGSLAHGYRVTDVEIRVPAFAQSPDLAPGLREDVAGAVDVTPTLLSLAGLGARADALGGRDLSRRAGGGVQVWGMRKTWAEGVPHERRIDGRVYRLPDYVFFAVDARGPHRAEGLVARFAEFEAKLRAAQPAPALDPEAEAALEALGYAE